MLERIDLALYILEYYYKATAPPIHCSYTQGRHLPAYSRRWVSQTKTVDSGIEKTVWVPCNCCVEKRNGVIFLDFHGKTSGRLLTV